MNEWFFFNISHFKIAAKYSWFTTFFDMADTILAGQEAYSIKFYSKLPRADDLFPNLPSAKVPGFWRKRQATPTGGAGTAGTSNLYKIGGNGTLISDMYLEIVLGATSGGNYVKNMATQLIERILIRHGTNELHDYNYDDAFEYLSTLWPNERKSEMQLIAGGAASGSATTVYAPIFAFWCNWKHEKNELAPPFPLLFSKGDLDLEITLRTIANIVASGATGGSLTSATIRYFEFIVQKDYVNKVNSALATQTAWHQYGLDIQLSTTATTVATATDTAIDLSHFKGDIKELLVHTKLSTDISTAHDYYINKDLTNCNLKVDGLELYKYDKSLERRMDNQLFNSAKVGRDATNGMSDVINFSRARDGHSWDGGINSNAFKKMTLNVTHALGANADVTVANIRSVFFRYNGGFFEKVL